jgi:hypothetical protein
LQHSPSPVVAFGYDPAGRSSPSAHFLFQFKIKNLKSKIIRSHLGHIR